MQTDLLQRLHAEIKRATPISEWFHPLPIPLELVREATEALEALAKRSAEFDKVRDALKAIKKEEADMVRSPIYGQIELRRDIDAALAIGGQP